MFLQTYAGYVVSKCWISGCISDSIYLLVVVTNNPQGTQTGRYIGYHGNHINDIGWLNPVVDRCPMNFAFNNNLLIT